MKRFITRFPVHSLERFARQAHTINAGDLKFGQPLPETHPHLLKPGELTPGISALEFHHRRAALADKLPHNSIAVIAAADIKYRSGAVFYEYHQNPNFNYLTGFLEPDSLAIIEKGSSSVEYIFYLLVRPKNARAEQWDGARSGVQAAQDVFNADESEDIIAAPGILTNLIDRAKAVYTDIGAGKKHSRIESSGADSINTVSHILAGVSQSKLRQLRPLMNELRVTKSAAELDCLRFAGRTSGAVISAAMCNTYASERQLWNDLSYGYKTQGLDGEAYIPVVGGGQNGLSIHYVRNDAMLHAGELVLVDSGGAYGGYVSDITRTWPTEKRFSAAQKDMYEMILEVQEKCIELCRENASMTLDDLHSISEIDLRSGLATLGFDMAGDALDQLFPHHLGHYIGLDVHDAPGFPRRTLLKENHCITIEPGVYVSDNTRWPSHFRGLAIRIEDSVRVGQHKAEVLTHTAAKTVDAIESLRENS